MSDKIAQIASLPSGELQGWAKTLGEFQPAKPGEAAALIARASELGVKLQGVSFE